MIDYGEAFSFPFKDRDWPLKFIIGGAIMLLSIVIIGIPVAYGYCIEIQQRVRRGEEKPLPEWKDVGIKFILGFKFLVTLFVYRLPLFILAMPFLLMVLLTVGTRDYWMTGFVGGIAFLIFIAFAVLYGLALLVIMPLIAYKFAEHERIREGLQVMSVLSLLGEHWRDLLLIAGVSIGIGLLSVCGLVIFVVGILLTIFYAMLVQFHLYGQIGRLIGGSSAVKP